MKTRILARKKIGLFKVRISGVESMGDGIHIKIIGKAAYDNGDVQKSPELSISLNKDDPLFKDAGLLAGPEDDFFNDWPLVKVARLVLNAMEFDDEYGFNSLSIEGQSILDFHQSNDGRLYGECHVAVGSPSLI
jgi:hypothetical protein